MSDLVERLRDPMTFSWNMRKEAADRIEELEAAQDHSELIANARRLYHGSRFKMDGSEMVVPLEDWEKIVAALGESV